MTTINSFASAYSTAFQNVNPGSPIQFENLVTPIIGIAPAPPPETGYVHPVDYDPVSNTITINQAGVYEFNFGFNYLPYQNASANFTVGLLSIANNFVFANSVVNTGSIPGNASGNPGPFGEQPIRQESISFAIDVLNASVPLKLQFANIGVNNFSIIADNPGDGTADRLTAWFTCERADPQLMVVPNTHAVSQVPTAALQTGDSVYVKQTTVEAAFFLDKASTATPNGSTILFTDTGSGRWFQTGWNVSPFPLTSQGIYVNKGGNDSTGNGSFTQPFLTIQAALNSIHDNSTTKRYAIYVGPGTFANAFQIKPWVAVIGTISGGNLAIDSITEITAPANTCGMDPSWAGLGTFQESWVSNICFLNHQTWDWSALAGVSPNLGFDRCIFGGATRGWAFNGPGTNSFDGVALIDCQMQASTCAVSNIASLLLVRGTFNASTLTVNSNLAANAFNTAVSVLGTVFASSPVTILSVAPSTKVASISFLTPLGNNANTQLTLNGANTLATFSGPQNAFPVTLTNSAPAPVLPFGTGTITGTGKSASIAANLNASSKITVTVNTPSNDALTIKYGALASDRVNGTPGSFKIAALVAAGGGAVNTADTSTVDYHID